MDVGYLLTDAPQQEVETFTSDIDKYEYWKTSRVFVKVWMRKDCE